MAAMTGVQSPLVGGDKDDGDGDNGIPGPTTPQVTRGPSVMGLGFRVLPKLRDTFTKGGRSLARRQHQ